MKLWLLGPAAGILPSESLNKNLQLVYELRDLAHKFADIRIERPLGGVILPGLPSFNLQTRSKPRSSNTTATKQQFAEQQQQEHLRKAALDSTLISYKDPLLARFHARPDEAARRPKMAVFVASRPSVPSTMRKALQDPFLINAFDARENAGGTGMVADGSYIFETLPDVTSTIPTPQSPNPRSNSNDVDESTGGGVSPSGSSPSPTPNSSALMQWALAGFNGVAPQAAPSRSNAFYDDTAAPLDAAATTGDADERLRFHAFSSALRKCVFRRAGCMPTAAQADRPRAQLSRHFSRVGAMKNALGAKQTA